jgi:hypothetical protein
VNTTPSTTPIAIKFSDGAATPTIVDPTSPVTNNVAGIDATRPGAPPAVTIAPLSNGKLAVNFSQPLGNDIASNGYFVQEATATATRTVQASSDGSTAFHLLGTWTDPTGLLYRSFSLDPTSGFSTGSVVNATVWAVDQNGNVGDARNSSGSVTLSTAPFGLTLTTGPSVVRPSWLSTVSGTWTSSGGAPPAVRVVLTQGSTVTSADATITGTGTSGTWSSTFLSGASILDGPATLQAFVYNNDPSTHIADANTWSFTVDGSPPVIAADTQLSGEAPSMQAGTVGQMGNVTFQMDATDAGTGLGWLNVTVVDPSGAHGPVSYACLGQPTPGGPVGVDAGGCKVAGTNAALPNGGTSAYVVNVNFTLPDSVGVGNYTVKVTAADKLGNEVTPPVTLGALRVAPRLVVLNSPDLQTPFFANASGGLSVYGYAAYQLPASDNTPSLQAQDLNQPHCDANNVCAVTNVTFYARARPSPTATTFPALGSAGAPQIWVTRSVISPAPITFNGSQLDWLSYYNYSPPAISMCAGSGAGTLNGSCVPRMDPSTMQVLAVAYISTPNGVITYPSDANTPGDPLPWMNVLQPTSLSALNVVYPPPYTVFMDVNESVVLNNQPWTPLQFNISLAQGDLTSPALNYQIYSLDKNAVVSSGSNNPVLFGGVVGSRESQDISNFVATKCTTGTFCWNLSNYGPSGIVPFDDGAYLLNLSITGNGNPHALSFPFFVQSQQPTLTFPTDPAVQKEVFTGGYVRSAFNLTFVLKPGYANVSSPAQQITLNLTLNGANGVLTNGTNGYTYWLNNTSFDPSSSLVWGNLSIVLPASATNGGTLNMSVTTDSYLTGGKGNITGGQANHAWASSMWLANASQLLNFQVDRLAPSILVDTKATVDSGNNTNGTLYVNGTAPDGGSATKSVFVRIVDLNASTVFDPTANNGYGAFVPAAMDSLPDLWVSSDVTNVTSSNLSLSLAGDAVKDVTFDPAHATWSINTSSTARPLYDAITGAPKPGHLPPIGFDRTHWYQIDAYAIDNLNNSGRSSIRSTVVSFDGTPPIVAAALAPVAGTGSQIGWHGTHDNQGHGGYGNFTVTVSDNECVARVVMNGTTPSGKQVPPGEFLPVLTPGSENVCPAVPPAFADSWYLNVSQVGNVTDELGTYTYWIDAYDAAGNKFTDTAHTVTVTVVDTQPAVVVQANVYPQVIQPGTRSTVTALVFENNKILYPHGVRATLQRLTPTLQIDPTFVDANGNPFQGDLVPNTDAPADAPPGQGPADPINGNGTGSWVASSDIQLNVTDLTEGFYRWLITVQDTVPSNCIPQCQGGAAYFRVSNDSPPAVSLDAPVGTSVVNATPTFLWRVLDKSITPGQITLQVGDVNGSLATVTPKLTALPPVGSTPAGYQVSWSPNLTGRSNYSVQLVANTGSLVGEAWSNFTVDANPPTLTANVTGTIALDGVTYAAPSTRVALVASDNETSVSAITYAVNGGTPVAYTTPVTPTGPDGAWELDATALDAAGNAATTSVTLTLDATKPLISLASPPGDALLVTVSDAGSGVDPTSVTVHYAYGSNLTFQTAKMTKAVGNSYSITLPGNATQDGLRFWFDAKDRVGNDGTLNSTVNPIVVLKNAPPPNEPPTVRIVAPANGSQQTGAVELAYVATDPEGQPLSVTIALREPTGPGSVLVQNGDNTGTLRVDLSGKAAGAYTLVVTVTDGTTPAQDSVTFNVAVPLPPLQCIDCPTASTQPANAPVNFTVGLNPVGTTVDHATYSVKRNGVEVANGTLAPGTGNAWTFSYTPTQPGTYQVYVKETDANGHESGQQSVGTFTVAGATTDNGGNGGAGIPAHLTVLLVLAVATIAVAGYGALVRWKK